MSCGAHPRTDVLRVRVRVCDLPALRKAARVAQMKTLENFVAEVIESAAATFRATKLDTTAEGKWDAADYRTARDTDCDVHRRRLSHASERRVLSLAAQGESDTEIARKFGCRASTIHYIRCLKKR